MTIRAKFRVGEVLNRLGLEGEVTAQIVRLWPVTGKTGEDKTFWDATPAGSLEMTITNQAAFGQLAPGKSYYLDFTLAD